VCEKGVHLEGGRPMKIISRDDDPELFAQFDRIRECEIRGHGELVVDLEGYVRCRECEDHIGCVGPDASLFYMEEDDTEDDVCS
jgi:hypothetical protein